MMMRSLCGSCNRPLSVCLCDALPQQPLHNRTRILILQHPHETRHKLATVPFLRRCLANCQVVVGRKVQFGTFPLLDRVAGQSSDVAYKPQTLLLFPGPHATDLRSWFTEHQSLGCGICMHDSIRGSRNRKTCAEDTTLDMSIKEPQCCYEHAGSYAEDMSLTTTKGEAPDTGDVHLILLAIDGTWQHATEMVKASAIFLNDIVVQVCLPFDINVEGSGMGNSDLILRKEPFSGCVTTMEAVATCLKILEPEGIRIEQKLLSVLRSMVQFQASHTPVHKRRVRPVRKAK